MQGDAGNAAMCPDTTLRGYAVWDLPKGAVSLDVKVKDYCASATVGMTCDEAKLGSSPAPKLGGTDEANVCLALCACPVGS